ALEYAVKYAEERQQFKKRLSELGMIRNKIAEMAGRIFVAESLVYRTVGLIDEILSTEPGEASASSVEILKGIEEYAIECSMSKVYASEMLDFVVDEGLQIFGGYGFCQEYPVERLYRDARINRIFEGTSEINRLLIPGMLLRRSLQGQLPLMRVLERLRNELDEKAGDNLGGLKVELSPLLQLGEKLEAQRKAVLMVTGLAVEKHFQDIGEQQELLALIADMVIEYFALESAFLRLQKNSLPSDDWRALALSNYLFGALERLRGWGRELLGNVVDSAQLPGKVAVFDKLCAFTPFDTIKIRDLLAEKIISEGGYPRI
ncbi:MAG: acyl-CoA dehydrogenase, partial [Deltaproteobacteria bacterium]|nr:acyl-CoA dehydrogenase [Deltaproteobacteria bacterium]